MPLRPRQGIETLRACPHGGPDYAELERLGFKPEEVLDFSASANPFGPPPGIEQALHTAAIDRYPDSAATALRRQLAERLGVASENIIVGNGSVELIRLIALAYFGSNDSVLIIEPTFGEYEVACRIAGADVLRARARQEDGFRINVAATRDLISRHHPKGIFLCHPNNPTGKYLARHQIEGLFSAAEDSLLILDEAYVAFAEKPWRSLDLAQRHNVVILRSMTKDYALAGLRLGYAIGPPDVVATLRAVCPPWNVNAVAQCAGKLALHDRHFVESCRHRIREAQGFLVEALSRLGLPPLPSQANFFLVQVPNARQFRSDLIEYGIVVRDCTSFGLPHHVRIATRSLPECQRLVSAIARVLASTS